MSANRELPHIFVLPEDDANRQIANGFALGVATHQLQVLRPVGGWTHVRDVFLSNHISTMRRFRHRHMVLLVDFDEREDRAQEMTRDVPGDLRDRVYVLGVFSEPEDLKRSNGAFENVGRRLAAGCRSEGMGIWDHDLLKHNRAELARMQANICHMLFAK